MISRRLKNGYCTPKERESGFDAPHRILSECRKQQS